MINYESLLRKYIDHVGSCEGTTFISHAYVRQSQVDFTPEELRELERMDREGLEQT